MEDHDLEIRVLTPIEVDDVDGEVDPRRIVVKGIMPDFSKDALDLFLEEMTDSVVKEIVYSTDPQVALIEFDGTPGEITGSFNRFPQS